MQPMDSHSRNAMSTDGSAQLLFAGQPLAHDSAALHVTGWADYTDDMAPLLGEAHAAVVASECAHAESIQLIASQRLECRASCVCCLPMTCLVRSISATLRPETLCSQAVLSSTSRSRSLLWLPRTNS